MKRLILFMYAKKFKGTQTTFKGLMTSRLSQYEWGFKREFNAVQNVLVWEGFYRVIVECFIEM